MLSLKLFFTFFNDCFCYINIKWSRIPLETKVKLQLSNSKVFAQLSVELVKITFSELYFNINCWKNSYVRFLNLASFGIIGEGAPSLSQWVGLER